MTAQIIDLGAWRRKHRAPQTNAMRIPFLLPTWPWGWLQPVLVEVEVAISTNNTTPARGVVRQNTALHPERLIGVPPSSGRSTR